MKRHAMIIAAFALTPLIPSSWADPAPQADLHTSLMGKFDAMNAKSEGIFNEDITPSVAAYFPIGQPIAETREVIAHQKLGTLKLFKGTNNPGMGTMFVARFSLTSHMFSHVYVVLDFDYDGVGSGMTLKMMKAYLRASNM